MIADIIAAYTSPGGQMLIVSLLASTAALVVFFVLPVLSDGADTGGSIDGLDTGFDGFDGTETVAEIRTRVTQQWTAPELRAADRASGAPLNIRLLGGFLGFFAIGHLPWVITLQAPAWATLLAGTVGAVAGQAALGRLMTAIAPDIETTAIEKHYANGRRAVVTIGTAAVGKPAQVRFTDRYGTGHYRMAEPWDPKDRFSEGAEVLLVRRRTGEYRLIGLE